jgi:hypothetical protein
MTKALYKSRFKHMLGNGLPASFLPRLAASFFRLFKLERKADP